MEDERNFEEYVDPDYQKFADVMSMSDKKVNEYINKKARAVIDCSSTAIGVALSIGVGRVICAGVEAAIPGAKPVTKFLTKAGGVALEFIASDKIFGCTNKAAQGAKYCAAIIKLKNEIGADKCLKFGKEFIEAIVKEVRESDGGEE